MLLVVWVSAFVPFTCVMGVAVGVCGWCVFQYCVAVVSLSRRVPGVGVCVSWLVPGACSGVGWLVSCVRVVLACSWCACVVVGSGVKVLWWFRMLTCLASFRVFVSCLVLACCLVNNAARGCLVLFWCVLFRVAGCACGCFWWVGVLRGVRFWVCVRFWVVVLFFWCVFLCASVFGGGVLGESVCWRVWLFG